MGYFFDFGNKIFKDVRNSVKDVVAGWNPEFATDLEIEQMEKEFDKINAEVTRAKHEMDREVLEYNEKLYRYKQLLAAAKLLQEQGHADKAMLQMNKAEEMVPDMDREKAEAEEATEYFVSLQKELNAFAGKITTAKKEIESKRRQAEMATLKAKREDRKAENARVLAGLKERTSGMASLAQIYDKQREEAEQKAESSRRKAEVFTSAAPSTEKEEDPEIAAAMSAAAGKTAHPPAETFEERLTRLTKVG